MNHSTKRLSPKALQRRIASHFRNQEHDLFAVVPPGLETQAFSEIQRLTLAKDIRLTDGGIDFRGPYALIFEANLVLSIPVRILLRVKEFHCHSYPELLDRTSRISWEFFLGMDPFFEVQASSQSSRLHHTGKIQDTVREGIRKHYAGFAIHGTQNAHTAHLPDSSHRIETDDRIDPARVYVRFFRDSVTLSMDTSGAPLFRRGYRKLTAQAPLRENLAAAILSLTDLSKYETIIDPFCGSGTLLLEAMRILEGHIPGKGRTFACESMPFAKGTERKPFLKKHEHNPIQLNQLIGVDISSEHTLMAEQNAQLFRALYGSGRISIPYEFRTGNSFTLHSMDGISGTGLLVSNLPYGDRVHGTGEESCTDPDCFVFRFLDYLAEHFAGWDYLLLLDAKLRPGSHYLLQRTALFFRNGGKSVRVYRGTI